MGQRGQLPNATYGLKKGPSKPKSNLPVIRPVDDVAVIPEAPEHLGPVGQGIWADIWQGFDGIIHPKLDRLVILRLAELAEQRERLNEQIESQGLTIEEPMLSPVTGEIVSHRILAHPLLRHLHSTDKQIDVLIASIGASPQARARLGLTIAMARQADAASLKRTMFRSDS